MAMAIIFVLTGCTLIRKNDQEARNGQTIFETKCVPCHGATGHGDGPLSDRIKPKPPDLSKKETQQKSDAELRKILSETETGPMSVWNGTFSDNDLQALITHIRSLH
jgi:high-affinity iron transporter